MRGKDNFYADILIQLQLLPLRLSLQRLFIHAQGLYDDDAILKFQSLNHFLILQA